MDAAALEARFAHLEQKIEELERENQLLRAVPEAKQDAREGQLLPRRALLTGAAYTLGAVGLSLVGTRRAEATTGYMQYGTSNGAGASFTSLYSTNNGTTLDVSNDSNSGKGLRTVTQGGTAFSATVTGPPFLAGTVCSRYMIQQPARMPQFTEGRRVRDLDCMVTARARARASGARSPMRRNRRVRFLARRRAPEQRLRATRSWDVEACSTARRLRSDSSRPVRPTSPRPVHAAICSWMPLDDSGTARPAGRPRGGSSSRSNQGIQCSRRRARVVRRLSDDRCWP